MDELRKKLKRSLETGKPLRVKYGIDPTGIDVHLGHTVPLRKLRLFQELGHQAVLIIGNYTALVGDPSGRDQTRARLTQEQVEANSVDYLRQVSKIIHIDRTEVTRNGDWFSKFSFLDVLSLTSKITMQRMLERDDFTKRIQSGTPIYLHECLYPLMQGHDSVAIRADVELGGSEQLFSLMVARKLQEDAGQEPQICLTLPILRGLDGKRRMGKSLGNYIGVAEVPYEMFAKVMSIPDDAHARMVRAADRPARGDEIARLVGCHPDPSGAGVGPRKQAGQGHRRILSRPGNGCPGKLPMNGRNAFTSREDPSKIEEGVVVASPGSDRRQDAAQQAARHAGHGQEQQRSPPQDRRGGRDARAQSREDHRSSRRWSPSRMSNT